MPSVELLQKTHDFPCQYVFKIIGKSDQNFLARVVAGVRAELLIEIDPTYSIRQAAGGRHLAITLEPMVSSAEQVLAIYRRLSGLDGVVMLF